MLFVHKDENYPDIIKINITNISIFHLNSVLL